MVGSAFGQGDGELPWQSLYTGSDASGESVLGLWQFLPGKELEDSSAHGHTLTLRGDARVVPDGKFGGCLESFGGGADNDKPQGAMVKSAPGLTPEGAFTLELWVKPKPEFVDFPTVFLIDKKYFHYAKDIPRANCDYCLYVTRTGDGRPVELPVGEWRHVAFTYDGAGTCRFFVDAVGVGVTRHEGRLGVTAGPHPLVIGDRVGSVHNGFPGFIDQVRLSAGLVPFFTGTVDLSVAGGRTAFVRMEPDASVTAVILNDTGRQLDDVVCTAELAGESRPYSVGAIPAGGTRSLSVPVDTRVRPGAYRLALHLSGMKGTERVSAEQSADVTVVPRPLPHTMPVLMWGGGDIETLKAIGFTHDLKGMTDYRKIWEAGEVTRAMDETASEGVRRMLNTYLAEGLNAAVYTYPGRWVERNDSLSKYLRVDRNGVPYPRHNITPNFPEVMEFGYNCGASIAETFGDCPALSAALVHSEIRDGTNISYHPIEREQCRAALGFDIPREATSKNGVHYEQIAGFPEDRVIPDDYRLLRFYQWFWKKGDGWNPLHTEVHRGLHSTGRDDLWTFFDPAVRVPSIWGSGGEVDVISQWTYSYPDPIKIGQAADELFAMAEGTPGQQVMKMTQIIWYRSQTAPDLPEDESKRVQWERDIPDAKFITISPDHLREAFWSKISRPVRGIMYHGWGSLVPAEHGSYQYTNPETRQVLTQLIHDVVQPLGPTLLQVPDRPSDVAVLESFSSQMFASRGTHGWSASWEADMHLILQWAGLQPRIVYDETILRDGLDGFKVLVMPYCDVLQQSVADAVRAFQERGGIVVADEQLAPGISPDILVPVYRRQKAPREDKEALQAKARDLWGELAPFYTRYVSTSSQDIVPRCRRFEGSDYVFVLNDKRTYGDYVGQHRKVMEKGLPNEGDVTVRRGGGVVYDLVAHEAVPVTTDGNGIAFHTILGPGEGRVYLVTQEPIRRIDCDVPTKAARGESLNISVEVSGPWGRAIRAVVPVDVVVTDPDGRRAEFSGYYGAAGGRLAVFVDLAENDLAGTWRVQVRELASGMTAERTVVVE
jgi:hypothetical protein